jgi:hypothetical protein
LNCRKFLAFVLDVGSDLGNVLEVLMNEFVVGHNYPELGFNKVNEVEDAQRIDDSAF